MKHKEKTGEQLYMEWQNTKQLEEHQQLKNLLLKYPEYHTKSFADILGVTL